MPSLLTTYRHGPAKLRVLWRGTFPELLEDAGRAAQRVLQSKNIEHLEAVAQGFGRVQPPRRYVVVDTTAASIETIAAGCSVSVWEARQWQSASRYRLVRVSTEAANGAFESGLREQGLPVIVVGEETVVRLRNPIVLESIDLASVPPQCTVREDPEGPVSRKELKEPDIALIVSGSIKREKVKDQKAPRTPVDTRLEDGWLVHLHLKTETRPWEIDPRRTGYEGAGLASAHMSTLELVRRLAAHVPHDEAFRNVVPALSPGADPLTDLAGLRTNTKGSGKEPKVIVLDNVAQFREYSAWRGAIETGRHEAPDKQSS